MNETYDAIVLGTGLKECILAGLLAKTEQRKILQLDRNGYYGSDSASLNLTNLWKMFRNNETPNPKYGENRDWNVDLIPKFVMSNGNLVNLLLYTNVSNYLEWKSIDGTFVYQWDKGGLFSKAKGVIHKVPATPKEAVSSDLMGLFEKNRCRKFFEFAADYDIEKKASTKDFKPDMPFQDVIKKFGLEVNTTDFIGHAVALYTNDDFLERPAIETLEKIKLYMNSIGRYGDSPFIYPVWGLSGLAEGFSRLCALHQGVYMLNRDVEKIIFDENGKFVGIESQGEVAYGKILISEPSYVQKLNKVVSRGKVIRCICILDHPIPKTKDVPSCQIILPQRQINRKNDIFIASLSYIHSVCKKGYYLAIISTMVETNDPVSELKPAFDVIGDVLETFVTVSDLWEPIDNTFSDNVFITSSFDAVSHFEGDTDDVLNVFKKITGKDVNFNTDNNEEGKDN